MPSRGRTFWLWYAVAWLPLVAFYVFAFYRGDTTLAVTLGAAAANVVPDAAFGVPAIHACRYVWRTRRYVVLAAVAPVFVAGAATAKVALAILVVTLERGSAVSFDLGLMLWYAFFSILAFAVLASVTFAAAAVARLHDEEARRARAELLRAKSELKALRAQVNPHFLFNTLHSVGALIRMNPNAAEEALVQLGDLLRYALRVQDAAEDGVLLSEEWEFVRVYLSLEKLRLGERLHVEEAMADAALQTVVPAFVLQPLVENAIRHGVDRRERGGTVSIRAQLDAGTLRLQVSDDGPGTDEPANHGTGKGLELVRQRLAALYGGAGSVEVSSSPTGYAVTLQLPTALES